MSVYIYNMYSIHTTQVWEQCVTLARKSDITTPLGKDPSAGRGKVARHQPPKHINHLISTLDTGTFANAYYTYIYIYIRICI